MRSVLRILLPLLVIAAAAAGAMALIASRPVVATRPADTVAPLVRVVTVAREAVDVVIRSQGTVAPRTETVLVPEIVGRVVQMSPSLLPGGFFDAGDILIRLDARDYELAVVTARAQIAQAAARLTVEEEESAVARREWTALGRGGDPAPLVVREPQVAEARATLAAAESALERAERDLARTTIVAPFAGRVRDKRVDIGQVVAPGNTLATLYAVDVAEIRLPLPDQELAFLDLPLGARTAAAARASGPPVRVHATFAGQPHQWQGRIVRTEGEIDPASRMVHLVAEVPEPYRGATPLAVGLYVQADIQGRRLQDVVVLPRGALRGQDQVLVVDEENRLRYRQVEVIRSDREQVIVGAGLAPGERVCVSPLDVAVDGMLVRTMDEGAES